MADKKRKVASAAPVATERPQKKSKKATQQDEPKATPLSESATAKSAPAALPTPANNAAIKSKASRKRAADFLNDGGDAPSTTTVTQAIPTEVSEDKSKKVKKARSAPATSAAAQNRQRSKKAQSGAALTADGVNGVIEHSSDSEVEIATGDVPTNTSLTAEGIRTADKGLEDEFGSEDEEDADQGAALLAGFDSDSEDNAETKGLDLSKTLPIPDYKKTSKKLRKAKEAGSDGPGAVYVGRIPHGFYEHPMRDYFSQFGNITRLRLSRNKKTGASKHFAFIEFESNEVAKIVAETMDNYLLFGHILKCKYAPAENLHPDVWKGANKRFRKIPHEKLERQKLEAPRTVQQWEKKNEKEQKKRAKQAQKLKEIGYEISAPALKDPATVLELRQLEAAQQASEVESSTAEQLAVTAEPAPAPEPEPKGKKAKTRSKAKTATTGIPLTMDNLEHQNADNALDTAIKDNTTQSTTAAAPTSTAAATNSGSTTTAQTTKKKKRQLSRVLSEPSTLDKGDYDALSSIAVGVEAVAAPSNSAAANEPITIETLGDLGNTIAGVADAELKKRKRDRKDKRDAAHIKTTDQIMADQASEVKHDKEAAKKKKAKGEKRDAEGAEEGGKTKKTDEKNEGKAGKRVRSKH